MAHFPPISEPLTLEEQRLAALALVAALPAREFAAKYTAVYGEDSE